MRGNLIVFEGIDGTGKGTLIRLLKDRLEQVLGTDQVVGTKAPGGTQMGLELRQILFHTVKTQNMATNVVDLLMLADHIQNVEKTLRPAMQAGKTIISDRYIYSQLAYSSERPVDPEINDLFTKHIGYHPSLIFFLYGDPEILLDRANKRTTENHQDGKAWNKVEHQRRMQDVYTEIFANVEDVLPVRVDDQHADQIFETKIWPAVKGLLDLEYLGLEYQNHGFQVPA